MDLKNGVFLASWSFQTKIFHNFQILSENISATILFDETVYQKTDDGTTFIELLNKRGIIPGIKVDRDVVPLFLSEDELTTQGMLRKVATH